MLPPGELPSISLYPSETFKVFADAEVIPETCRVPNRFNVGMRDEYFEDRALSRFDSTLLYEVRTIDRVVGNADL